MAATRRTAPKPAATVDTQGDAGKARAGQGKRSSENGENERSFKQERPLKWKMYILQVITEYRT